jgi:hypothetical protein
MRDRENTGKGGNLEEVELRGNVRIISSIYVTEYVRSIKHTRWVARFAAPATTRSCMPFFWL